MQFGNFRSWGKGICFDNGLYLCKLKIKPGIESFDMLN